MKTATSGFISAISDSCPYHTVKFYLLGAEIDVIVKSFNYYGILSSTDGISIGNTCSSYCEFELYNNNYNLENNEVQIKVGVEVNGSIEYVSLGYFIVKNQVKQDNIIKYTAFDRMIKLEDKYSPSSVSNLTTVSIINDMCSQLGFEFENTLSGISVTKNIVGYTYREMFGFISALHGANCIFNDSGKLEFVWFTQPSSDLATIDESVMYENGLELTSNSSFKVKYLKCATGETIENTTTDENEEETTETTDVILSVGSGTTGITLSNPLMTQEILTNIYNTYFFNFEYQPCTVKRLGNILLEVGDIVTVNLGTKSYSVPIMTIQHSIDGGVITDLVSLAETETEQSISYESPTQRYVAQTVSSEVGTQIQELSANMVTTDYIASNYAKINLANITKGCIENAMIKDATISDAKIVELTANKISAGTLSCDRLLFNGSDKSIVYYLNNMGNLVSEEVNTINGDTLTERTITADKIVANSISANEINVFDLFAQNITATGTITGLTVNAGEIYGSTISGGSLYIGNSSGTYASISSSGKLTCTGAKISGKLDLVNGITFNSNSTDVGSITYDSSGFNFNSNVDVPLILNASTGGSIQLNTRFGTIFEVSGETVTCYGGFEAENGITCNSISITGKSLLNSKLELGNSGSYYISEYGNGFFNNVYIGGTQLSSLFASYSHSHSGYASSSHSHNTLSGSSIRIACNGASTSSDSSAVIKLDYESGSYMLRPTVNGGTYLGSNQRRWKGIYTEALSNSSDRRIKKEIDYDIESESESLIYNLKPISFKYNDEENPNKRYGIVAQDFRDYLIEKNINNSSALIIDKQEGIDEDIVLDVNTNEEKVFYSVDYTQFIAPLIKVVQKQKKEIDNLKNLIKGV